MSGHDATRFEGVEMVLGGDQLDATMTFFSELGFELTMLEPADAPALALLEGHGIRLRLDPDAPGGPGALRLTDPGPGSEPRRLVAPNGTVVDLVPPEGPLDLGPLEPSFVVVSPDPSLEPGQAGSGQEGWHTGRAGMRYRDLIPDRQGGRFVASHIAIPDGGPVPDYVHYHHIAFQLIYCRAGWAELVYESQGPPFRFEAGDCVLQPPHIRHRVLATSDHFEAVELGCPAVHQTHRDRALALPTPTTDPDRTYGDHRPEAGNPAPQRFALHRAAEARWEPWRFDGFTCRRFGFGAATNGVGGARVVRPDPSADGAADPGGAEVPPHTHEADLVFWFVTTGWATLGQAGPTGEPVAEHHLGPASSVVLPAGGVHGLVPASPDLELLEVTVPAWPAPTVRSR